MYDTSTFTTLSPPILHVLLLESLRLRPALAAGTLTIADGRAKAKACRYQPHVYPAKAPVAERLTACRRTIDLTYRSMGFLAV